MANQYDVRDYKPFYDRPSFGFGFDNIIFTNRAGTLKMHGRWSFWSRSRTFHDKKLGRERTITESNDNWLVFHSPQGRALIYYDAKRNVYVFKAEPAYTAHVQSGYEATQTAAEQAALRSLRSPWLHEPINSSVKLTTLPQQLV
jgi:hypothetical protein